tara:strand:+ start:900 stop:1097 length:198 start_codon:yes stop_codon:yes gene_type:complete
MPLEAEREIKLAIEQRPEVEAFSLIYFNFLWESGRTDEGFDEMRRFEKYGGSPVYREMVRKINGK